MNKNSITRDGIKLRLDELDIKYTDIASAMGVTSSHVIGVVSRRTFSKPVANAVCLALDLPLHEVFGDVDKYFSPKKRGPKERTERKTQVIRAIQNGQPVPAPERRQSEVYA